MQIRLLNLIIFFSLLLCSIAINNNVFAQQKWLRTFGVDVQVASLTNINSYPYRNIHSIDSKSKMYPSPYFLIGRTLGKKFSVHIGVQFQHFSNITKFQYFNASNIVYTLNFKYHYLGIPIMLNYKAWQLDNHNINVGLSLLNNYPIASHFHYNGSYTHSGFDDPGEASQPNFFGKLAVQYYYQIKDNKSIGLNIFAANGLNNIYSKIYSGPGSDYYRNSKLFYYGMGLNYQF